MSAGAASLQDALSAPECILTDLNISWNLLTPAGGLKLAEGLEVIQANDHSALLIKLYVLDEFFVAFSKG
jgi:hypothetical protein